MAWFFDHLDDVLSDMSVFHRVDELDQLPASVFLPRMVRLPAYDGAVRHALSAEAGLRVPTPAWAGAGPQSPAEPPQPRALTGEQIAALGRSAEYGAAPGLGQRAPAVQYG